VIPAAYWLSARACHLAFIDRPIIEVELVAPQQAFNEARRAVQAAVGAIDTADPPDHRHVVNVLCGGCAVVRCGTVPEKWAAMHAALVGSTWPERLPPAARLFVGQRWDAIQKVAAELLYERRVAVSRVYELAGLKLTA